ncbi:MAG: crotonase/enoyl-CoA hydratase family protein [Pseudomonadota bacterium]
MSDLVHIDIQDDVATLTMDDGKANALSLAMSAGINAGLDRAEKEAKAIILKGRPGVLCGGFDLKVIRGDDEAAKAEMRNAGMVLLKRLYLSPLPLIIACTGHSVAAGGLMLLTGDTRIGTQGDFKIGLNEIAIGLALPVAGIELARDRLVPDALTSAVILSKLYDPDEAATVGYLDKAVSADALAAEAQATAKAMLELDPAAFAETKLRMRQPIIDRMTSS